MATINSAIQSLVDHLHGKMTSNEPLTAEEQTLVANAIDKLSTNTTLEQALIAVATEHLDTATSNMATTLSSATDTFTTALEDSTTALTSAQTDINKAKDDMAAQNANLAIIPQVKEDVQAAIDEFAVANTSAIRSNLAGMVRPVFGITPIEATSTNGNNQRSQAVFTIYDSNGESYLARPSYGSHTSAYEYTRLEFLKLAASGQNKSTIASHYVHSSTYYSTPTTYIYRYGSTAILPLAKKSNANDIAYDVVYSTQNANNANTSSYHGIYCRSSGNGTTTKPKQNINATDQWGVSTITSHSWDKVGVLYNNDKHCLVIVDASTSQLIEKYRDGNVNTNINISNTSSLQSYVNNGNFTVVCFIANELTWLYGRYKYLSGEDHSSNSYRRDMFGYYGQINSVSKMGGNKYNAHYRFTQDKILEPLNFYFTGSVNANTSSEGSLGECHATITDQNENVLGVYKHISKSDYQGYQAGYIANSIMCINPYSNVGIINEHLAYGGSSAYYGISRTCKAF